MQRFLVAFLTVLTLSTVCAWSDENNSLGAGYVGVGYDEGLLGRLYILDNVSVYLGLGYYVKGADSVYHQPLNRFSWKIGGEYTIKKFNKLSINAFGEWREEVIQGETEHINGNNTMRYNKWNTIFRIGIRPEWFLLDHLSIDYKLGLQYFFHGPTYSLNEAGNDTERNKDGYSDFGVYCAGRSGFPDNDDIGIPKILLNIGVTIYITKLPFFNK